jgi:predicted RNA-binding protein
MGFNGAHASDAGGGPGTEAAMCQTTAYIIENGEEVALLSDIVSVVPEEGQVRMINLFGEERKVAGRIKQIDLLAHKLIIGK